MRNPSNFTNELYQIMTTKTVHFNEFMFNPFPVRPVAWCVCQWSTRRARHWSCSVRTDPTSLRSRLLCRTCPCLLTSIRNPMTTTRMHQAIHSTQLLLEGPQVLSLSYLSESVFPRKSKNDAHMFVFIYLFHSNINASSTFSSGDRF